MPLVSAHWFDLVVVVVLVAGFITGARKETLPQLMNLSHWALTLFISLFLYKEPALWLAKKLSMQPDVMALIIFPFELLLVFFLLGFVWRRFAEKFVTKEPFGHWEHRLTKAAGALRLSILLLVVMAWVSGRYVTEKDLRDHQTFCEENFGGITFPVLRTVHDDMFNGSFSGRFAKKYLSGMLMTAIPRVEYEEKPMPVAAKKTRKVKLRELDENFERDAPVNLNPDRDNGGKDRDAREEKETSASTTTPSAGPAAVTIYRDLTLKGISGSGDKLFALINDQTFQAGELNSIRIEDRKIVIQCIQILGSSVLIRLEDEPNSFELKLGVATNLKGEPVVKK